MKRHSHQGQAATAIPVFLGIVGLSACFFVLFTIPGREAGGAGVPDNSTPVVAKAKPSLSNPPKKTAAAQRVPTVYLQPEVLLAAVTGALRENNLEGAMKLSGPVFAADAHTNFLKLLLTKAGYRVPPTGDVFVEAGVASGFTRYQWLLEPDSTATPAPDGALWVDLARDPATASWQMRQVILSPVLLAQGISELRRHEVVIDPAELVQKPDPLQQTNTFLSGVLGRNFHAARVVTDREKVTQEKLAGLCIVFEEGGYQLAATRPIVVTAASKDAAIALVRVRSENQKPDAEIGITLHPDAEGAWRIEALDFSRLLESYVQATGTGEVFYSPLVKSPQGGESLVVYFDFNSAKLVARATSQLDIVARLLATDPAKKLRISGHADELGTDDFNFRLSADRAKNVREYLHKLGVNPKQIETLGFGSTAPLVPNTRKDGSDNPEGRSRNRRTEIYLDF